MKILLYAHIVYACAANIFIASCICFALNYLHSVAADMAALRKAIAPWPVSEVAPKMRAHVDYRDHERQQLEVTRL
jgi:hypothetical protein